jgi:hypothetical protein
MCKYFGSHSKKYIQYHDSVSQAIFEELKPEKRNQEKAKDGRNFRGKFFLTLSICR